MYCIYCKKMLYNFITAAFRKGGSELNLKEIDYVLAVAEHHSISKAAKSLYIYQPALSRFIRDQEHKLDLDLFCARTKHDRTQ